MLKALVVIAAVAAVMIVIYNRITRFKFLMQEGFSGIDVQLKRRWDLVPNLVEAVKGYAGYEKKLLEDVTQLRSQLLACNDPAQKIDMEKNLAQAFKTIFALAENYPDLKADSNFLSLHKTLVEIEDDLQMARRYYNGTVRNYNIAVQSFPGNLVAQGFNFRLAPYFEIEYATERKTPEVNLKDGV